MNPLELPKAFQDALGIHEGLRKLGFAAKDIFFLVNTLKEDPLERIQVGIQLRAQDRIFTAVVGLLQGVTGRQVAEKWAELTQAIIDGKVQQDHLDVCWQESPVQKDPAGFLQALKKKGFLIPRDLN